MKQELNIIALWYNSPIFAFKCLYILIIPLIQSSVFYSRRYGERRYMASAGTLLSILLALGARILIISA